ncbi:MAG: efflux RND transporter periplasmic adaptor subunit [Candidatus Latescibacteria bacterium]|nr:efflux RND transporter periplasmic adaptor subunit [Candidatus Latescibacterota bacterium]
MRKRMFITLGIVFAIIAGLGLVKYRQIQVAMSTPWTAPPEAVTTVVAKEESWVASQSAIGTCVAVQGVTLSADLPGVVAEITFDSGRWVKEGEVLVRLDTSQEVAQLAAAEAQSDLAKLNLERAKELRGKKVISEAEFDRADAEAKTAAANAGAYRAIIARKTIRAPFSGILGIRQVNLGQYLAGGDPIVPLQALDPIYVNFSLPQQDVAAMKVGADVNVMIEGTDGVAASGKITAFNSLVDAETRNVEVQASFRNPEGKLRPGMFVRVQVVGSETGGVIALPVSAINYAPYGDSVFIVENVTAPDSTTYRGVRQQFVKLGASRGDQVAVLSGVKAGEEVVSSGVFKLRPGVAVEVNNSVTPSNDPAPKPEDS